MICIASAKYTFLIPKKRAFTCYKGKKSPFRCRTILQLMHVIHIQFNFVFKLFISRFNGFRVCVSQKYSELPRVHCSIYAASLCIFRKPKNQSALPRDRKMRFARVSFLLHISFTCVKLRIRLNVRIVANSAAPIFFVNIRICNNTQHRPWVLWKEK